MFASPTFCGHLLCQRNYFRFFYIATKRKEAILFGVHNTLCNITCFIYNEESFLKLYGKFAWN